MDREKSTREDFAMVRGKWAPYFTDGELRCTCATCQLEGRPAAEVMDHEFMDELVVVRKYLDFPLPVNSAYRCPSHNNHVSSSGFDGPHTTGKAIDIRIYGYRAHSLLQCAMENGWSVGIQQNGDIWSRFLHLDSLLEKEGRPRPWVWSY